MAAAPGLARPGLNLADSDLSGPHLHDSAVPGKACAKLILADQLTLMREGLAAICRSAPGYEVVGQCADGEAALRLIQELRPDIAVLDIHLTGLDCTEVVRTVKTSDLPTKTAVLSTRRDRKTVLETLRAGASAFLLKSGPSRDLIDSFEQILGGGIYLAPQLQMDEIFLWRRKSSPNDPLEGLSPREFQVFNLLVEGLRPKDIGDRLRLSPKTVDTYRASLMRKLDIHDVAGLVKFAIQRDFVS